MRVMRQSATTKPATPPAAHAHGSPATSDTPLELLT